MYILDLTSGTITIMKQRTILLINYKKIAKLQASFIMKYTPGLILGWGILQAHNYDDRMYP